MRPFKFAVAALAALAARGGAQCTPAIQKLLVDQRYDEARAALQPLVGKGSKDDASLHCMGRVYMAMEKPGDAIEWLERSVALNEKSAAHHLWLGNALGDQAQHTAKLKLPFLARRIKSEFERAVELDPTLIDARQGLIEFYSQAPSVMGGSMDKAKEQAREIGKLNEMRGHIALASLLDHDKDLTGAEKEFTAAIAAAPDSAAGYSSLANFYRRQKRYAESVTIYDRLLAAKPDAINARLNIASSLVLSNQNLDRAERELKLWFASPPKDTPKANVVYAHYLLGSAYEHQSKRDAARAEYQAALAINANYDDAKKALAALK